MAVPCLAARYSLPRMASSAAHYRPRMAPGKPPLSGGDS
jgi:hypothetical protein